LECQGSCRVLSVATLHPKDIPHPVGNDFLPGRLPLLLLEAPFGDDKGRRCTEPVEVVRALGHDRHEFLNGGNLS
ncbi:MAG: hypothetical protein ABIQ77_03710, partial [Anaerolineales bacterium]